MLEIIAITPIMKRAAVMRARILAFSFLNGDVLAFVISNYIQRPS
ncbi:hypothetical protein GPAL_0477 [Glaciecola pallidula DSM 14239 = ACAM 615]|uniref:Uncharacterized protein n=1 Tax=Brumicola pallidula DSM 14239 = ACAM 615 TaxID=1121922 RepID=K6ZAI9_9ALTE|nr:hypothetical protein GPAL_0477 [Glaciecola pallidula DSM 14239 = ACAM 615]